MSEQEFRSIYKQYHKKLCYFLNYYTHDEQAIEEAVQDVFVYLWKESDNLNITYLKTYLYSSARNRMLNYLRNEHTRTIILERWAQMELEERQAQDCIDRAEFFLLLQDTIEALPPKCREIFLMSRDERKTYKEIAEEKGISVKTVEAQMDQKIPHTLLAKHFVNQTSVEESKEVRRWRAQSPENEKLYQEYLHEWEIAHADFSRFVLPDSDKMWGNILSRINEPVKTILYTKKKLYKAIAVAASIALLVGLSFSVWLSAYYRSDGNYLAAEAVFIVPSGQKSQLILPDGTKVWMNSDSKLTYPVDFSKKRRLVKLEGEAYFDVVHDENKKFIVNTSTVNVLVHGTSFSVTDYPADSFISVALDKGSVSVETSRERDLLTRLVPGQKVQIAKSDISWNVSAFDAEAYNIWMLNKLQFKGESLYDVFRKIERWYGVKIRLENENPSYSYWFTLKTESLTEMLNLINQITPIDYKINGEEVTIRYK